jgi:hypothetical protein
MFWLGGFPALEVTTSTPDALCPPIEEARAAIHARVGEVQGDYHVNFSLVRGLDGRQRLELVVREAEQPVLERALPLDDAGCQDAAQALALVLERYFDAVERSPTPDSNVEPISDRPSDQSSSASARPLARELAPPPAVAAVEGAWRLRAGFLYDLELGLAPGVGAALFPVALRARAGLQLGLALDVTAFLWPLRESVRQQEISAFTLQSALSMPLTWRFGTWSTALGPWAQLRLQRAKAAGLSREQPAFRWLPGFGAAAEVGWSPAASWTLGLGFMAGAQAPSAASRFVLRRAESGPKPVLVPERWFGQSQLTLSVRLY